MLKGVCINVITTLPTNHLVPSHSNGVPTSMNIWCLCGEAGTRKWLHKKLYTFSCDKWSTKKIHTALKPVNRKVSLVKLLQGSHEEVKFTWDMKVNGKLKRKRNRNPGRAWWPVHALVERAEWVWNKGWGKKNGWSIMLMVMLSIRGGW